MTSIRVKLIDMTLIWVGILSSQHGLCKSPQPFATLPVVVHVIHTGAPVGSVNNPTDEVIGAMISLMNEAFQKNGPFYGGANVEFAFGLANQSPDCEPTTGINRIDGSGVANYSTGGITTNTTMYPNSAHELLIKGLSRWPNTDYINIWLVNMIDGNPFGLAGYAYFPEYNNAFTDGVVMRANAISDGNKTIIHELGHYFGLYHTFGDAWTMCISEPDCSSGGDYICDTENCRYTTECNSSINPCSNAPWLIADAENNYTVLHNYMGYTNCQWMFTEEQKDVMHYALNNFRPGLLSSKAIETSTSGTPALACMPGAANGLSPFYGVQRVEFGSLDVYSNSSEADGAFYIDRTCNQQVEIPHGESIFVRITGSFENTQHIRVYLDYDNDGVFETPDELILAGYAGVVQNTITLPMNGPLSCTPLRLRVVTDHPSAPPPTACSLTGTSAQGVGQIEDYTVIIGAREIESVASGNWDNPEVWSCNCVPSEFDVVILNSGHTIQITPVMGVLECGELRLDPTAYLDLDGELRVAGGCNF